MTVFPRFDTGFFGRGRGTRLQMGAARRMSGQAITQTTDEGDLAASGIHHLTLRGDAAVLKTEISAIILEAFGNSEISSIESIKSENYYALVLQAQNKVNALDPVRRLVRAHHADFSRIVGTKDLSAQRISYLRAVRPSREVGDEFVDFHRESLFNPDMVHAFNVWIPLSQAATGNVLRYVPGSHHIPDEEIVCRNEGVGMRGVEKFGAGHKVGLLYDRKTIVSGVDFSAVDAMRVPEGQMVVFDGNLIHGAGRNDTNDIRFSLDFRIIPARRVMNHSVNFAAGDAYFTELYQP